MNALLGAKKTNVSSTPGKTKHFQTHVLPLTSDTYQHSEIILCDCPGLVFPSFATTKADMVVNGVLPIDHLREPIGPTELLVKRIPKCILEWIYGLRFSNEHPDLETDENGDFPISARQLLCAHAISRGYMKAGQGNPDESKI